MIASTNALKRIDSDRLARSKALIVRRMMDGRYEIWNPLKNESRVVNLDAKEGRTTCGCPDSVFRKATVCKHTMAAMRERIEERKLELIARENREALEAAMNEAMDWRIQPELMEVK